jgi:hypothetical protein
MIKNILIPFKSSVGAGSKPAPSVNPGLVAIPYIFSIDQGKNVSDWF